MPYAQINYQEKLGNSGLSLAEAGCFVCADSNLLEKIGIQEAPDALNAFYEQHNLFQYDLTDRANDDITWSTVTKFHPQLVVKQIGTSGFPDSDLAEVEFRYKDHLGQVVTHFCAVNHATDHSIIDSWDGKVKTPAEYESYYGQPIAWATFENHVPTPEPAPTPAAPVSAPKAVAPAPQPPAPAAPKQLVLPKTNNGKYYGPWHVYKPGGPYTLLYAIGALDVYQYGPMTFDILGNPAPNIYLIQTKDFGEVAIYAGPDTVAQFPGTGHGEGESVSPTEPSTPTAPANPEAPAEPGVVYERFKDENGDPKPMDLVTKPGAQRINFVSGTIVDEIPEGAPFDAVGKATLPNKDVYYMTDNDFGIADETQRTPITVGIKTVYLGPAPAPQQPDVTATHVAIAQTAATPDAAADTAESDKPADDAEAVPVTVKPPETLADPNLPWQRTERAFMNPQDYVVKGARGETVWVTDFATGEEIEVKAGTPVKVGSKFQFGGHYYYRAQSSIEKRTWYGFPVTSLVKQDANNTPFDTNDDINQIGNEISQELSRSKHAAIKAGASAQGLLARFRKTTKE